MKGISSDIPVKYVLEFSLEVNGPVDESDVIGAIFGQTEGLLGPQFDLRELQRSGRIGRIVVKSSTKNGKTAGKVIATSAMDMPSTALLAALIESVNQIGPYEAKIRLGKITDYRRDRVEWI